MDENKTIGKPVVVPLESNEHRLLKAVASACGLSMGAYVGKVLRRHLAENELAQRLGKALSGSNDHQGR